MPLQTLISRWLGLPPDAHLAGQLPVLAILPRRLSDDEVISLGHDLEATCPQPADHVDVAVALTRLTDDLPSAEELTRVSCRLRDAGFAVEHPALGGARRHS